MDRRNFHLVGRQGKWQARLQQGKLGGGKVRYAEVTNFAAMVKGQEGFRHFIRIHQRVWTMDQQQIKMVGCQITQRLFGAENDMVTVGNIVADGVFRPRFSGYPAFGDDFHPAAQMRGQL